MNVSFPKGYTCPQYIIQAYPDLEKHMLPLIKRKAKRMSWAVPGIDVDDAIQEGRLTLLSCLIKYDCNKCDFELKRYVGRALASTFAMILGEAMAQRRMPRLVVKDENGEWLAVPKAPMSLEDFINYDPKSEEETTEERRMVGDNSVVCHAILSKTSKRLDGLDKAVFSLKYWPPADFLKMIDNKPDGDAHSEPTNVDIAEYLAPTYPGLTKGKVDFCLYKIRGVMTEIASAEEFSEVFGEAIKDRGWPMIHISEGQGHDKEYVRKVIADRKLDPKPLKNYATRDDFQERAAEGDDKRHWARLIERYPWGIVMVVKNGAEYVTMVIECDRFNASTGDVFGKDGSRDRIPVPWYATLVRKLRAVGDVE